MYTIDCCPRCQSEIPEDRKLSQPTVCAACGWTPNTLEKSLRKSYDKQFTKVAVVMSVVIVAGFIQLIKWDRFALEVIPYQIKNVMGGLNAEDTRRLAEICVARNNAVCVEELYVNLARNNQQNLEHLAELGMVQYRRGRFQSAIETFRNYFAKGGISLEASYAYAQSLGRAGQIDEASNWYQQVLKAKPETLQITVAQNFVHLLLENNRRDQALSVLDEIRSMGSNTANFMETEYRDLAGPETK